MDSLWDSVPTRPFFVVHHTRVAIGSAAQPGGIK